MLFSIQHSFGSTLGTQGMHAKEIAKTVDSEFAYEKSIRKVICNLTRTVMGIRPITCILWLGLLSQAVLTVAHKHRGSATEGINK